MNSSREMHGKELKLSLQTLFVLKVILANPDRDHYGLELTKAVGLKSGTVYPILARLEAYGWLKSDWEKINPKVEGRRARRYYRLTEKGLTEAKAVIQKTRDRLTEKALSE